MTGVDVDGVFANFYLGMCRIFNKPYVSMNKWSGMPWINEEFPKIENLDSFWRNLPILNPPDSITFKIDCYVSACPKSQYEARLDWLFNNGFPKAPLYVTGHDKGEKLKELGVTDFLDDSLNNCRQIRSYGINAVHYLPCYMVHHDPEVPQVKHISDFEKYIGK